MPLAFDEIEVEDRLDSLICWHARKVWPEMDWRLIKAVVKAESGYDCSAVSPCGARGLMQLMHGAFDEKRGAWGKRDRHDPDANLDAGIRYLRDQWEHWPEIPDPTERLRFALASYNCGRGYINVAVTLARKYSTHDYRSWSVVSGFMADPRCQIGGKRPDHRQVTRYVDSIMGAYLGWAT